MLKMEEGIQNAEPETFEIADLFCGAGGTSLGIEIALEELGADRHQRAVNHWERAIQTHSLNHPDVEHYVQDLYGVDPEAIVPEGRLDLLVASPECRFFSRARGGKPIHEQGRMNPWIIQRWLTSLNVTRLLVENVPEFVSWGPLNEDGRPDRSRKGLYFEEWVRSLWGLGYEVQWRTLNSADYGDATTRVRFFLQARNDGQPIRWPEPSHAKNSEGSLLDELPRWRGAREIIDWTDPGRSLMDDPKYRRKPLSSKTRQRIARGLRRFGGPLAPLYIRLLNIDEQTVPEAVNADDSASVSPFHGSDRNNTAPRGIDEPIPTVTTLTGGGCYIVQPVAQPFLLSQQSGGAPRPTDEPAPTITGGGAISFVQPMIVEYYGKGETRSVDDPLTTATTKARHALAQPTMVRMDGSSGHGGTGAEAPAVHACIVPNFGERSAQKPRVHNIDDPAPTVTSRGAGCLALPTVAEVDREQLEHIDPRRVVLLNGEPYLLDIRYRMLRNTELARAMSFTNEEREYQFVGNVTEVTKQIGNAVPVRTAAALVKAMLAPAS